MEEKFMEEALELARQAAADGEVPVGCVIVRGERSWAAEETAANAAAMLWHMRRWKPSAMLAKPWAAGGCGIAPCM